VVVVAVIKAVPMTLAEANEFVANYHRHNKPVPGARFAIGASNGVALIGVAIVSRPVSRVLQSQGADVAEVTRCCVSPDADKGACSFLYAACWRAWRAMGGRRLVTYTLQSESGASLRGAGWRVIAELEGAKGAAWTNRPGREWQSVTGQAKLRWEMTA
jgi:hypothetical protein